MAGIMIVVGDSTADVFAAAAVFALAAGAGLGLVGKGWRRR